MAKTPEVSSNNISITCFGGNGGYISGSCHRLDVVGESILVDCGLFQGRGEEQMNNGDSRNKLMQIGIGKGVSHVLLTHSHIDHIGRTPWLFAVGYKPEVVVTSPNVQFISHLLYDSAKIQELKNKKQSLYTKYDVDRTLEKVREVSHYKEIDIGVGRTKLTVRFLPNGHVMGSDSLVIGHQDENGQQNILFTGDMGKPEQSLCGGYQKYSGNYPKDAIDTLVVESTNFLREPISFEEKRENLLNEITTTWDRNGTPILPVLSFHRFQEILEMIHNSQKEGLLPKDCHVVIDAPLGTKLLKEFKELKPEYLSRNYGDNENYYLTAKESASRFDLEDTILIDSHGGSKIMSRLYAKNRIKTIIIASGGMCENGRVVNYLRGDFAKNPKNKFILTCFQVPETKGSKLIQKKSIFKGSNNNNIGAEVVSVNGFTSHISGPKETFDFLESFNLSQLKTVIINHGKDESRRKMAEEFKRRGYGAEILLPRINQRVNLK